MNENEFKSDVLEGLSNSPKYLSSKYFYDDKGSAIFEEIMRMPEYYLTACENEILQQQSDQILKAVNHIPNKIIEFGSGDGTKTKHLLKALSKLNPDAIYIPIDISAQAIARLTENILNDLPKQILKPVVGDYFSFRQNATSPSLFLFLGSNVGNYTLEKSIELLKHFNGVMNQGDSILIGFDLQKSATKILDAYNDQHGITKRFNLNLLERINRELDANFNLQQFDFFVSYSEKTGELKSYLKSLLDQSVLIQANNQTVSFSKGELIWTELSQKYNLTQIEDLASASNFKVQQHFQDSQNYFTLSLWTK
jgi:L-histidine N-alpha-methyltransferase